MIYDVKTSKAEKIKMYMEMDKIQLAEMLAERDELEEDKGKLDFYPFNQKTGIVCRSWKDCTNPHMDCIDCPLRNIGGSRNWVTDCTMKINGNEWTRQTNTLNV